MDKYTTLARTIVLYFITVVLFLFRHVTYACHPPRQQLFIHRHLTQAYSLQHYRHVPQRFRHEHSVAHARAARGNMSVQRVGYVPEGADGGGTEEVFIALEGGKDVDWL